MEGPRIFRGKRYYNTRKEAENVSRKNDRIYYAKELGYYIIRP